MVARGPLAVEVAETARAIVVDLQHDAHLGD
jgi:hypothetical protein